MCRSKRLQVEAAQRRRCFWVQGPLFGPCPLVSDDRIGLRKPAVDYDSLSAADLVRRCAESNDPAAWDNFVRRFHPMIASVVLRTAHRWGVTSTAVLDDVIQEIYLKLCCNQCRLLRDFKPHHENAIFGYLKVVAANAASDYFKSRIHEPTDTAEGSDVLETMDTRSAQRSSSFTERQVLIGEIDACLQKILPDSSRKRDYEIFWLHYRAGMSARAIAELGYHGLTTKGVESTLLRLIRLLRQELGEAGAKGF